MKAHRLPLLLVMFLALALLALSASLPVMAANTPLVIDDFDGGVPKGTDSNSNVIGFSTWNGPAGSWDAVSTKLVHQGDPLALPGQVGDNNILQSDYHNVDWAGFNHAFQDAAVQNWVSQDWSSYFGLSFWIYGNNTGARYKIEIFDNKAPGSNTDTCERFEYRWTDDTAGWKLVEIPFASFVRGTDYQPAGAPNDGLTLTAMWGYAFTMTPGDGTIYIDKVTLYGDAPVVPLQVGFAADSFKVDEGGTASVQVKLNKASTDTVRVNYASGGGTAVAGRHYTPASGILTFAPGVTSQTFAVQTFDDGKYLGSYFTMLSLSNPVNVELGTPAKANLWINEADPADPALIDDFEVFPYLFKTFGKLTFKNQEVKKGTTLALPGQGMYEKIGVATYNTAGSFSLPAPRAGFGRDFAAPMDWSSYKGLSFWYRGANTGKPVTVFLKDNRVADQSESKWKLVWSDEFNGAAGTAPNPKIWNREIGDGTQSGNVGWGNGEREYYTNSNANSAMDGAGHLVITAKPVPAGSTLQCYYGPCEYTSARLTTQNKFEVSHGRIEARIRIPYSQGLWPAFWMLGNDIPTAGWPGSGEIDIMENVGKTPSTVYGTIHGPGYSGGNGKGGNYTMPSGKLADAYHTYAVEWEDGVIRWYLDGINYATVTKADIPAGTQWVYDHGFFLLLNVAVGGGWPGMPDGTTVMPQTMNVDYVRVYQAVDTAERFEAKFADNFTGWKQIQLPFTGFTRSATQPAGAPSDGLSLKQVWGYGFEAPRGIQGTMMLDQVRLSCSGAFTVKNTNDSGPGSLRDTIAGACPGAKILFASTLANQTIGLTSTEITIDKDVTIDGAAAPGLVISGSDKIRQFVVNAGKTLTVKNMTLSNGYGFQLGGAIISHGTLTLDRVTVKNNKVTTGGQDWWQGGAGLYIDEGATLNMNSSTVADNDAGGTNGAGILARANSKISISNSTISGNTNTNVGGGIRWMGSGKIVNSTISGNTANAWHGGAIFFTDGTLEILNSTITGNNAQGAAIFIGSYSAAVPTLKLTNSIVSGNSQYSCAWWEAGAVNLVSGGNNIFAEDTCKPIPSDILNTNAGLGPLAANGGSTWTHALLAGSPAIDAANDALAPATDQRGISRPKGAHSDIGSYEY